MKRILVTDTHLGVKKANIFYLDTVLYLFQTINEYAEANGIEELIHLGDFFDNRKSMSLLTLAYAKRIGLNLQKFKKCYFILGNHDIYYKDRYIPNSHQLFAQMQHIQVVDEPTQVGNMLLVPWILEGTDWVDFGDFIGQSDARFCLGHFEINGAHMNVSGRAAENCHYNATDFSKFELTLSGHYHTPGTYGGRVKYIGAPYHQDFNDSGPRGFYVFDDEDGSIEFVEYTNYPKYIQWVARPGEVFAGEFTGQIVKIIFNEDYGTTINNQIIQEVQNTQPYQLFTEYKFSKGMTEGTIVDDVRLMGPKEVHRNFIEHSEVPAHLSKKTLYGMVEQLYGEIEQ